MSAKPTVHDFFCGAGLATQGLKRYFDCVYAIDNNHPKSAIYAANHGQKHLHVTDIRHVRGAALPPADLSWASFPCQDLSLAGKQQGLTGDRSGLVWEWLRIIDEMPEKPKILVAENVMGLFQTNNGAHFKALCEAMMDKGYLITAFAIDAARWLPQSRKRLFTIGIRDGVNIPAEAFRHYLTSGWCKPATLKYFLANLCNYKKDTVKNLSIFAAVTMPEPPPRKIKLGDIFPNLMGNSTAGKSLLEMMSPRHVETLYNSDPYTLFTGFRRTRNGKQAFEIRDDGLAGCLRAPAGGSSHQFAVWWEKDGEYHTRVYAHRLTPANYARLMGVEAHYVPLHTPDSVAYRAFAEGVAVPVVDYLAKHLLAPIAEVNR